MTAYDRSRVLTHSMLDSFRSCAHRVYLENVADVKPRYESAEARRGTIVHNALAMVVAEGHKLDDAIFVAEQKAHGEDLSELAALWGCVRDRYGDPPALIPDGAARVECEYPFFLDSKGALLDSPDGACFAGTIDLLAVLEDGRVVVRDYKTGRNGLDRDKPLEHYPQLRAYAYAASLVFPDAPSIILQLHYIRWNSGIQQAEVPCEEFANVWAEIESDSRSFFAAMDRLEYGLGATAEQAFPPSPSDLCAWCSVRHACPEWSNAPAMSKRVSKALDAKRAQKLGLAVLENKPRFAVADKMLRAYADAHGPIDLGDGRSLGFVANERAEVSTLRFVSICEQHGVPRLDMLSAMSTSKTALDDIAKRYRKTKPEFVKALYDSDSGAVSYAPSATFTTAGDAKPKAPKRIQEAGL